MRTMSRPGVSRLGVWINGLRAGTAARTAESVIFRYDSAYLPRGGVVPLSASTPLVSTAWDITNWVDGVLPDDRSVRREWAADHGVDASSAHVLDLLATPVGLDCAGAVQFSATENVLMRPSGRNRVSESDIAAWADAARSRMARGPKIWPRLQRSVSFSLAGAQPKQALYHDGNAWYQTYGDIPTNRILKVGVLDPRYDHADAVEFVCMRTAAKLGVRTAPADLLSIAGRRVLSVHRFDRAFDPSKREWVRIHTEDMCQSMGIPPSLKYERYGGPGVDDIVRHIRRMSADAETDLAVLADLMAFNWAIGNTDAHAKNHSLYLSRHGVRMAPAYDLLSMYAWHDGDDPETDKILMAIPIGDSSGFDGGHAVSAWERIARTAGIAPSRMLRRLSHILRDLPDVLDSVIAAELTPDVASLVPIQTLSRGVRARAARSAQKLGLH